jgi:hypothetical protein
MKNKIIMTTILCIPIVFAGCEPTTKETVDTTSTNETDGYVDTFDEDYENLDISQNHISIVLNENVTMDADITPQDQYRKQMGIYNYSLRSCTEADTDGLLSTRGTDWISDVVSDYNSGKKAEISGNLLVADSGGFVLRIANENVENLGAHYLSNECYRIKDSLSCNEDDVKNAAEELLGQLDELVDFEPDTVSEIIHYNDSFLEKEKDMQEKYTGIRGEAYNIDVQNLMSLDDYYYVQVRAVLEGIPVITVNSCYATYDDKTEMLYPDNVSLINNEVFANIDNRYEMVFDKNLALVGMDIFNLVDFDEQPESEIEILDAKEMVKILHDDYKETSTIQNVEIYGMYLNYAVTEMGTDSEGKYIYRMAPAWVVVSASYFGNNWSSSINCYSAVDGTLIGNIF